MGYGRCGSADRAEGETKMIDKERIKHIFRFIKFGALSEAQENLVINFEEQFLDRGRLSDRQVEILEDIFRRAAVYQHPWWLQ